MSGGWVRAVVEEERGRATPACSPGPLTTPAPLGNRANQAWVSVLVLCFWHTFRALLCLRYLDISPQFCASLTCGRVLTSPRPGLFQRCAHVEPSSGSQSPFCAGAPPDV